MLLPTIETLNLLNQTVFVRADLNVPLAQTTILNDYRLSSFLPTLALLVEKKATIIIATHLGTPTDADPALSTKILIPWFTNKGYTVTHASDLSIKTPAPESITLLENLRFFKEETTPTTAFAQQLSSLAHLYINDAFGLIHRKDTSVTLTAKQFPKTHKAFGLLMKKELTTLSALKTNAEQPYLMIIGGKKIATKLRLLLNITKLTAQERPHQVLVGGALATTLLKAQGMEIGQSFVDLEALPLAQELIVQANASAIELILPHDVTVKNTNNTVEQVAIEDIPHDATIIDIGPKTWHRYSINIARARTIFLNGTMGIYEQPEASLGTKTVIEAIAKNNGKSIAGGGDAVAAIEKYQQQHNFTYISTGGGATLAFLTANDPFHYFPTLNAIME